MDENFQKGLCFLPKSDFSKNKVATNRPYMISAYAISAWLSCLSKQGLSGSSLVLLSVIFTFMFFPSETVKVHEGNILKIVWLPPEYGDAVACISTDGIVSLLEEIVEGIIDLVFIFLSCFTFNSLTFQ